MKTYVTLDATTATGFALVVENDDGTTSTRPIEKFVEDGRTLALPENPSGRMYLSVKRASSAEKVELISREARTLGGTTGTKSTKISFSDSDLEALPAEMADTIRAAYGMLEAVRERSKIQAQIEKYKALIAQLEGRTE